MSRPSLTSALRPSSLSAPASPLPQAIPNTPTRRSAVLSTSGSAQASPFWRSLPLPTGSTPQVGVGPRKHVNAVACQRRPHHHRRGRPCNHCRQGPMARSPTHGRHRRLHRPRSSTGVTPSRAANAPAIVRWSRREPRPMGGIIRSSRGCAFATETGGTALDIDIDIGSRERGRNAPSARSSMGLLGRRARAARVSPCCRWRTPPLRERGWPQRKRFRIRARWP